MESQADEARTKEEESWGSVMPDKPRDRRIKFLGKKCLRFRFRKDMHVNVMWGRLDKNCHGAQKFGEKWNREMICGPRFKYCRLEVNAPSTGHRVWFYFPSGKCWNFDIYLDRRNLKLEEVGDAKP